MSGQFSNKSISKSLTLSGLGVISIAFAQIGCDRQVQNPTQPKIQVRAPIISRNIVGSWHGDVQISKKLYNWNYTFYSDGTFFDQGMNTEDKSISGGIGKYLFDSGKVTISWDKSQTRENATVTWTNPNEMKYVITSHSDDKQVGLEIIFRRGDPPKPPVEKPTPDTTISRMSAGRIESIIKSFQETTGIEELDNDTYKFNVGDLKILLFNKGTTMQLSAIFSGSATSSRINEWNRTKRFSRAYIDDDNQPVLEADIELNGGVNEQNVKEWMKTYVLSLTSFKQHLEE